MTSQDDADSSAGHQGTLTLMTLHSAKGLEYPVVAICGSVAADVGPVYDVGIDAVMPIVPGPMSLDGAIADACRLTADAAERLARLLRAGGAIADA